MDAADPQILPVRLCCISCTTSLLLTLMFDIYSHLDTWYVMDRGRDKDGCGRSVQDPCNTLLYLLQQVNRTHLPPDKELHIVTDKSLIIDKRAARFLVRSTTIEKYVKSSTTPTINVSNISNVTLSVNETFKWTFSGLNINVSRCRLDSIRIIMESSQSSQSNNMEYLVEEPKVSVYNSSFGTLDFKPGTKAEITQCHMDGQMKQRPTLITANNSVLLIQNCQFLNFINEKGSTILFRHNNSQVTIENSVFTRHNSSMGVLFLQSNSSMCISGSSVSQNAAFSLSYSSITLRHGINAIVNSTVFRNNSALIGGAVNAEDWCKVALHNCTFSSNQAITGKTLTIQKNPSTEMATNTHDANVTFPPWNPTSFNQTLLQNQNLESIKGEKLNISKKSNGRHLDQNIIRRFTPASPTLFKQMSRLQKPKALPSERTGNSRNSTAPDLDQNNTGTFRPNFRMFFKQTSSDAKQSEANAIDQTHHLIKSSILRNSVRQEGYPPGPGGAVFVATYSQVLVTNCVFEGNLAQLLGGAIFALSNVTLDIQETTFAGNSASQSGAIDVQQHVHLHTTHCTFIDNHAEQLGGAIIGAVDVVLEIQETNFTGNSALESGAIDVQQQCHLSATDCTFMDNHAEIIGGAIVGGLNVVLEIQRTNFTCNSASQGGAINVQQQVNISLTNCRLDRNSASDDTGAILAMINVTLEIRETNFTGNTASTVAGAMSILQAECHVVSAVFHRNTAKTTGGAVYIQLKSLLQIENTNFTNNNGSAGGAISVDSTSTLQAFMCIFWKNFAKQLGGAIQMNHKAIAVITNCHFLLNHAAAGSGGAINLDNPEHASIRDTFLLRNVASRDGGAIDITGGNDIIIDNVTCIGNHATGYGGCLDIESVTLTLNNSDISENVAHSGGAGVFAMDSRIQIINTLLKQKYGNNAVVNVQGEIYILLQMCHFMTNITAVTVAEMDEPRFPEINLRMSQCSFSLKKSDKQIKIIYFHDARHVSWMLWKTKFQINSYHTMSNNTNFTKNLDKIIRTNPKQPFPGTVSETQYASASPLQCSDNCRCHYFFEEAANVLNCSLTNLSSLTELRIPNETMWLVAKSNHMPYLQWSESLKAIEHFDFQNSSVRHITDEFFSKITTIKKTSFLNLANNNLRAFPKTLNRTSFSEVYLAGNPIDCNCDMLWFAHWLNTTEPQSQNRIVKDYKRVLCAGGRWNGTQVYNLSPVRMGCFPKNIPKWIIEVAAGVGSFALLAILAIVLVSRRWREIMFLRYIYFGKLPKDKPEQNEAEMRNDAFFCYSQKDFRWVREVFITGTKGSGRLGRKLDLERDEGLTFHLLQRDSNPANTTAHNVVDAIDHSKRVIIILSANFLEYEWGMETFRIAHDRVVNGRNDLLIVVLKEKINVEKLPPDLRPYIRMNSYIDGTKNWKNMKKRLRFLLPRTPLKEFRGEKDEEDIWDQYHAAFQAPGTTTEEAEADNDSRTSNDEATGFAEARAEGGARYLGGSIDRVNNPPNVPQYLPNVPEYLSNAAECPPNAPVYLPNAPEYLPNAAEYLPNTPEHPRNTPEYDTTGSINLEAEDVQAASQVHQLPDSDETSNDDSAPLLANMY